MSVNIKQPFEGLKVIDLTTYLAAPLSARLMADFGADVIKIESFKGDPYRTYGAAMKCPVKDDQNPVFDAYNSNKRSCPINLKTEEGKEILFKLLETADVFVTNNRDKSLKKMGIDYASIKERYPRLVYVTVSGYGLEGPEKDLPGFDSIAFYARTGLLCDTVVKGNMPAYPASAGGDNTTGLIAYAAIVTALLARERTGRGDHIDVSLFGNGVWMSGLLAICSKYGELYPKGRYELKPVNNNVYQCRDGEWVAFTILEFERYFRQFCQVLECPELADDPRWQTRADALNNREPLIREIEKVMLKFDSEDVERRLRQADVVVSRLHHFAELDDDEQALSNDYMRKITFDNGEEGTMFMNPLKSENIGRYPYRRGPLMGEDTDCVLGALGYSEEQIRAMKESGIVM